jgi:MarR family transcriptional regulator, organic hydroperoxide resistance regulator
MCVMEESGDTPGLSAQICFDLYAASRAVTAAYRPALDELGLTYPQYLVMIVLWERGTCTVKDLADALLLDHGTLTPLVRRMEQRDLVTRRRGTRDERFVEVVLTPHGDQLRGHADRLHCDMKAAMGLGDDGLAALQRALREVTASVGR